MLTNDEIEQMKGVVRKCIYGIPDSEGQVARDTLDKIVAELLTLREAVAPQMAEVDALRGIEGNPHVIDEDHAYGDQEVYYGVLTETNFVEGEQSVVTLVACVSEESAYLSDNHGDLRDIDEFNFVVGPFKR